MKVWGSKAPPALPAPNAPGSILGAARWQDPPSCLPSELFPRREKFTAPGMLSERAETGLRLPATRVQPAERGGGGGGGVNGGNGAEVKRVRGREVLVGS